MQIVLCDNELQQTTDFSHDVFAIITEFESIIGYRGTLYTNEVAG